MSIPRPERVSDMFRQLEAVNLRKLRADLIAAVKRERACGTNIPDGYPSGGTSGGTGHGDPTLAAIVARETARQDRLRQCTHTAAVNLEIAVRALAKCEDALQSIAMAVANQPITPTGCDLCTEAGLKDRPWDHHGSVGGKLNRDMYLCNTHYQFVHRNGYAPSPEQTTHWDRTGSWRIPASERENATSTLRDLRVLPRRTTSL